MRWYDPAVGRFTTRDPFPGFASLPQTQHPYVYVGNNPVNLTDPGGEIAPIIIAAGAGAAIGAVVGGAGYVIAHPGGRPEDYLRSGGFWQAVGIGAASGAVAGAVGWAVPALLPAAGNIWGAMGISALTGALASGAGQITANVLNPCAGPERWYEDVPQTMITGGVIGGLAGGAGWWIRQWVASHIGSVSPPTDPRGLRLAMGAPPRGMQNPQVHHELPWKFKDWFAGPGRGLNVNDPAFGRWVEGTPPGQHQNWSWAYNDAWETFIQQNPNADRWQVLAFLSRLLSSGRFQ